MGKIGAQITLNVTPDDPSALKGVDDLLTLGDFNEGGLLHSILWSYIFLLTSLHTAFFATGYLPLKMTIPNNA